ncbi:hypothetical protein MPSEU_000914500 [Mayamaea pseudoterrestris]|nr:hypothetical protein MPSEU_000914500 [Mayamaea pseudoterrestris]
MRLSIVLQLLYAITAFRLNSSSPTGASGCDGNGPAVGGPHLDNDPTTGSLEGFGLKVSLESDVLQTSGALTIPANRDHLLYLYTEQVDGSNEFRGFLFRLANTNGESTLGYLTIPESILDEAQVADTCTDLNITGITHVNNDLKSNIAINLNIPEKTNGLLLDVTAVIMNRLVNNTWTSEYYSSQYQINVGGAEEETDMPTTAPFDFPDGPAESTAVSTLPMQGYRFVTLLLAILGYSHIL